jgi:hypothetical protein
MRRRRSSSGRRSSTSSTSSTSSRVRRSSITITIACLYHQQTRWLRPGRQQTKSFLRRSRSRSGSDDRLARSDRGHIPVANGGMKACRKNVRTG